MSAMLKQESADEFFREVDRHFTALSVAATHNDKEKAEPILYNANSFQVRWQFELPVPCVSGSIVKYFFATGGGDIRFKLSFLSAARPAVVVQPARVPSDVEPIAGSFKSPREGTLLFHFDNSFSWFTAKELTYQISLIQPAFKTADEARALKCRHLLQASVQDTRSAKLRLAKHQQRIPELREELLSLHDRITQQGEELARKREIFAAAEREAEEMAARISSNNEKKPGLCLRTLSKSELVHVLSFLGPRSPMATVSKYFHLCCKELQDK